MIDFYYSPTPNARTIALMLAETGLDHRMIKVCDSDARQIVERRFLDPDAKLPGVVDQLRSDLRVSVFETSAILLYLSEKSGKFGPSSGVERSEFCTWLFAPELCKGAMDQDFDVLDHFFTAPSDPTLLRAFSKLETRLKGRPYAFDLYSIVDMALFSWAEMNKASGFNIARFSNVARWHHRIATRPAVRSVFEMHIEQSLAVALPAAPLTSHLKQFAEHMRT